MDVAIYAPRVPPEYAGGGRGAARYANKLAERGHDISLFTHTRNPDNIENVKLNTIDTKFIEGSGPISNLASALIVFVLSINFNLLIGFDVVHCYGTSLHQAVFGLGAKLTGTPTVMETTLLDADDPVSISNETLGFIKVRLLRAADHIVALSPEIEERVRRSCISNSKCVIIPNTVDVENFSPVSEKKELRKGIGIEFSRVMVSVGVLKPRKNQREIFEIFRKVSRKIPDLCLVFVGPVNHDSENAKYVSRLKREIELSDLENNVIFTGYSENVRDWLRASDVFLFSSFNEGLPFSVIEAMSTGIPCIVKKMDSTTDFIFDDGVDGIVYSDMNKAIDKLIYLFENESEAKKIGCNARKKAREKFSDRWKLSRYESLYEGLVS